MIVLYKGLENFQQLTTYLQESDLNLICSNVTISCAVHDQNLDESMDITGVTTTNIQPKDFCKDKTIGCCFLGNKDNFNLYEAICSLKLHLQKYQAIYKQLADTESKHNFKSLLLYWLCPYTTRFFDHLNPNAEKESLDFQGKTSADLEKISASLKNYSKPLHLSLASSLSDFVEIPSLLLAQNPNHQFTFQIYREDDELYTPVLTMKPPEATPKRTPRKKAILDLIPADNKEDKTLKNDALSVNKLAQLLEDKKPQSDEVAELHSILDSLEQAATTEPQPKDDLAELSSLLDSLEQSPPPTEPQANDDLAELTSLLNNLDGSASTPSPSTTPTTSTDDLSALTSLLNKLDLPSPEKAEPVQELLPPNHVAIDLDCVIRARELLGTMDELVNYLKTKYPVTDPICTELLDSMLLGVNSIRNVLEFRYPDGTPTTKTNTIL